MSNERIQRGEPIKRVKRKDGSIVYRLIVDAGKDSDGKRRQVCSTHNTLREARDHLAEVRTQVKRGEFVARHETTVSEFLTDWLKSQHGLKPKTVIGYENALSPVMGAYGRLPIQSLTRRHLDELVRTMLTTGGRKGEGRTPRTVELTLVVLQAALDQAVEDRLVHSNVAKSVKRPKQGLKDATGQAWTADQARAFLSHVADDRYAAAWRLSLYGLRRGEVLGLSWDDIDMEQGIVTVRQTRVVAGRQVITETPKNKKARIVPVGQEVLTDLMALKMTQDIEARDLGHNYNRERLVFVNEAGDPMRPETYTDLFLKHAANAGLPRIRLHDLRHTAASLLASSGVPILTAAGLLGHDPKVFAQVYAHLYPDDLKRASNALAMVFAGAA